MFLNCKYLFISKYIDNLCICFSLQTINSVVVLTQATHDVPGTFPEDPLKVLTSRRYRGTFRGLSEDQYTNLLYNEKIAIEAIVLVLHIYSCCLQKKQIFKSSKRVCPRKLYWTQLRDVPGTK